MGPHPAVATDGLTKRFGTVTALDGVDLEVRAGTVLGLLGPNGAGKTTTVRILATLLAPDAGRAWVDGLDVVRDAHAVRSRIGLSGQDAAVDAYLTGHENLVMIGRLSGLGRAARKRAGELIERFDLADAAGRPARTYSGGMRRRLDLAASLVAAPSVLFLDEPTTGLDLRGRLSLWAILEELTERGTTLLLTTQYLEEADRLADTVAIIDGGKVIADGTPDQLKGSVGGDRLELTSRPGDDPHQLAAAVAGLGTAAPAVDTGRSRVVLPVADGPAILPELAARLSSSGLHVADLSLRRPTLDDVFFSLTGRTIPAGQAGPTSTHPADDALAASNPVR